MAKSKHHILPKHRGGSNEKNNIKHTTDKKHDAYNLLFGTDCLPEEAVMTLITEWWYKEPNLKDRKLHQLVMELAKLLDGYINKQRENGFRAGAGT